MRETELRLVAGADDEGKRIDKIVRRVLSSLPLSAVYMLFRKGSIRINGRKADADARIRSGDELLIASLPEGFTRPVAERRPQGTLDPVPPLAESASLAFFNKPRGMLVHGPDSLEERVRDGLAASAPASLSFVPGPLHRLDRNTSGIVAFPRSAIGAREFSRALREHLLVKEYLAVVTGVMESRCHWLDPLERLGDSRTTVRSDAARVAETFATPAFSGMGNTLCVLRITTGITHQIRAQAAIHGFPLSGDAKYEANGGRDRESVENERYVLHAFRLSIPDGVLPEGALTVTAPLDPVQLGRIRELLGSDAVAVVEGLLAGQKPKT